MSANSEALIVNSDDPSHRQTIQINMYNNASKPETINDTDHNETYAVELETTKIIDTYNENNTNTNKIMEENNMGKYKLININYMENKKSVFNNNKLVNIGDDIEDQRKINTQLRLNELKKEFKSN